MKKIDFILFMGQSNMAGRGAVSAEHPEPVPQLIEGAGYEYRAVSAPGRLSPLEEPFGITENRADGINDPRKSGSMVTSFVNTWYTCTGIPVVGVSASKGGSSILRWQPGAPFMIDAEERVKSALRFFDESGITVRRKLLLWCQGESDGDCGMSGSDYISYFTKTLDTVLGWGLEHCYMVKIGKYNGSQNIDYSIIRNAQEKIASTDSRVTICSRLFETMRERGLMKDDFHYFQEGYNEVGADAARTICSEK